MTQPMDAPIPPFTQPSQDDDEDDNYDPLSEMTQRSLSQEDDSCTPRKPSPVLATQHVTPSPVKKSFEEAEPETKDDEELENLSFEERYDLEMCDEDKALFELLQSKKKENAGVKDRINLLKRFYNPHSPHFFVNSFPRACREDPTMLEDLMAFEKYIRKSWMYSHRMWKNKYIARLMLMIWRLMERADDFPRREAITERAHMSDFRSHMEGLIGRMMSDMADEENKKKRGSKKLGLQPTQNRKNGTYIQSLIMQNNPKWQENLVTTDACPGCGLFFLVYERRPEVVNEECARLRARYDELKRQFYIENAQFEKKKGRKKDAPTPPPRPTYPKVMVACMCIVLKCRDMQTGKGCPVCNEMAIVVGRPIPWVDGRCTCSVCMSNCSLYFPISKIAEVRAQIEAERLQATKDQDRQWRIASGKCIFILHLFHFS